MPGNQGLLEELVGALEVTEITADPGDTMHGLEGMQMVAAERSSASSQGVLVELGGALEVAKIPAGPSETVHC